MCDTDLEFDLKFAPGEPVPDEHEPPSDDRHAGVAWG